MREQMKKPAQRQIIAKTETSNVSISKSGVVIIEAPKINIQP